LEGEGKQHWPERVTRPAWAACAVRASGVAREVQEAGNIHIIITVYFIIYYSLFFIFLFCYARHAESSVIAWCLSLCRAKAAF
jgi:hypothetical protein